MSAALEAILAPRLSRRDRLVIATGLAVVCVLAWLTTAHHAMMGPEMAPPTWTLSSVLLVFGMWLTMMAAMMVPAAFPMISAFAAINRRRQEQDEPYVATAVFLLGYVLAWGAFSAVATVAQAVLQATGLLSGRLEGAPIFGAVLFVAAGLYQWSSLKQACLTRCRTPVAFILSEWRDGPAGAVVMGLMHGAYCMGCCAALMALLFAVAVMDLRWMAALTVLVSAEKLLPWPNFWRHAIAIGLVAAGLALGARAIS